MAFLIQEILKDLKDESNVYNWIQSSMDWKHILLLADDYWVSKYTSSENCRNHDDVRRRLQSNQNSCSVVKAGKGKKDFLFV